MEHSRMSDRIGSKHEKDFIDEETVRAIQVDFMGRLVTITIGGLGLITALAWDRTLEDIFIEFFGPLTTLGRKLTYTLLITVFAVLVTILLRKIFIMKEEDAKKKKHK